MRRSPTRWRPMPTKPTIPIRSAPFIPAAGPVSARAAPRVNAAPATAMAAHADETDDTNPIGPVHPGCGAVSAALATAELAGRTGEDLLRAITLGYDIGARMVSALGVGPGSRRYSPSCLMTTFVAATAAAAMLRLDARQVRHTFSYAAQQASGLGFWTRDREHV